MARIKSRSQRFNINSKTVRFRWGKSWAKVFKASELLDNVDNEDEDKDEEDTDKGVDDRKDNEEEDDGKDNEVGKEKLACDNVADKDNKDGDEEVTWMTSDELAEVEYIVFSWLSKSANFFCDILDSSGFPAVVIGESSVVSP